MAERRSQLQPQIKSDGRDALMDLDTYVDLSSWPFDPLALLSSTSNPPSPLWFFEATTFADFSRNPMTNGFKTTNGNINQDDGKTNIPQPQLAVVEDNSGDYCLISKRMTQAL